MMNTESDEKTETKEQITETKTFIPKTVHIIIAVIVIALLSVFIFVALSGGGERPSYFGLRDKPIEQKDLIHIFSGNYNGKSVLITVKDVKDENGKVFMIFDLKCDFVPVASGCKCVVNLLNKTYDFTSDENAVKKIPLGNGTILRSSAGKVIFKSDGFGVDKIDLLQL
ncbi:MAG: hypothetical protein IIU03_07715 [Bacteroidales bacterium]|nr:hypothetical protein [Bacteroidales bacterium]